MLFVPSNGMPVHLRTKPTLAQYGICSIDYALFTPKCFGVSTPLSGSTGHVLKI